MKTPTGCPSCTQSALSSGASPERSLFPPQDRKAFHDMVLDEILDERVSSSRSRVNFRGVKRKMSNYNLRPRARQPTRRIEIDKCIEVVK